MTIWSGVAASDSVMFVLISRHLLPQGGTGVQEVPQSESRPSKAVPEAGLGGTGHMRAAISVPPCTPLCTTRFQDFPFEYRLYHLYPAGKIGSSPEKYFAPRQNGAAPREKPDRVPGANSLISPARYQPVRSAAAMCEPFEGANGPGWARRLSSGTADVQRRSELRDRPMIVSTRSRRVLRLSAGEASASPQAAVLTSRSPR
jgi:hypothetical protein